MKKVLFLCLSVIPLLLFNGSVFVNRSSSYIVIETTTNRIIEGSKFNEQSLVASTAKILTAITAIENYSLEENIIITKEDVSSIGSKVYLETNEVITRKDLLYALMLRSANDAASALSSNNCFKFITQMNETAKKIGMKNSVFTNASGLDEKEYNLSTAYDMALLASYAAKNDTFTLISEAHSYSCESSIHNYSWTNKHRLVKANNDFLWGKTGFTKKARRILVSNYLRDNMNLIVVTINVSDDWNLHKALVERAKTYEFVTIFKKGIYNPKLNVDYYLVIDEDIVIPLKEEEMSHTKIVFILYQKVCELKVLINEEIFFQKEIKVYDKDSFDYEHLIELN